MKLGCIIAVNKWDVKFFFFIFKSCFSYFHFLNPIIWESTDHFSSFSAKYPNTCEGREEDPALTLLRCLSWLQQLTGARTSLEFRPQLALGFPAYPLHKQGITGLSNERVSPEIYRKLQLPHPVYSRQSLTISAETWVHTELKDWRLKKKITSIVWGHIWVTTSRSDITNT